MPRFPHPTAWPVRPSPSSRCRSAPSPRANAIWRDPGGRRAVWPSVLGGADGWSPDSNRRMRTRWRRSRPRPRCSASPGVPPSGATASQALSPSHWALGRPAACGLQGKAEVGAFPALSPPKHWFLFGIHPWILHRFCLIQATHLPEPHFPLLYKGKCGLSKPGWRVSTAKEKILRKVTTLSEVEIDFYFFLHGVQSNLG